MIRLFLSDEEIDHLFMKMTQNLDKNKQGFTPLNFQRKIIHTHLNEQKNVILHAPTGAGKTLAALSPFFISNFSGHDIDFPKQSIYALPMRTLAHNLAQEAKNISDLWKVTIQTGEVQEDPFFIEGDVIFTTIDQTLSGALTIPLSLPFRLANINAGVWPGSYLIFDEFHLLDPTRSFQTTVHLLKQLCTDMQLTRFTIMTATLSRELREILSKELNAVHIEVTEDDLLQIKSQYKKKRRVVTHSNCLNGAEILAKHKNKTIVIVNQVDRAMALYREINEKKPTDTEIFLLHSRLLSDERKGVEDKLNEYFGKHRNNKGTILIATQVIEVGLDISSDVMLTEISSAQSFLQRIGRNARFEGEEGTVHVYSLNDNDDSQPWLPYEKEEVAVTETYLQNNNGSYFDFFMSNTMIDAICGKRDKDIWQKIKLNQQLFKERMADAFYTHEKGLSGVLIRKIKSVSVLVHDNPPNDESIYLYETISFPIGKIKGFVADLIKAKTDFNDKIQKVIYKEELSLKNVENVDDIRDFDLIIIHPSLALYEENIGLTLGKGSKNEDYKFPIKNDEKILKRYIYKVDTFPEHIKACLFAYTYICYPKLIFTIKRLSKLFNLSVEDIKKIVDFVIVMHDAGKLSKEWQTKAMSIQREVNPNYKKEILLAHTDNPSGKRGGFPSHSVLGAVLACYLVKADGKYQKTSQAVLTAIAHHHTAIVEMLEWKEQPIKGLATLQRLLKEVGWDFTIDEMKNNFASGLKTAKYKKDWKNQWCYWHVEPYSYWLYLFLVRQLRISDQRSFNYIETIRNQRQQS